MEIETLKIFKRKSKHKFGGTKVCTTEEVRKCLVNPKIEIKVFG